MEIAHNIVYEIPKDFPSLQSAFNTLCKYTIKQEVTITLKLASGIALDSGLKLYGGDFSQYKITSDDLVVYLAPEVAWVNNSPSGPSVPGSQQILFLFDNCKAPVFDILVDMQGRGQHGYSIINNASGVVTSGSGVKNCGWHNLVMSSNAQLVCNYAIWTGAGKTGMYIQVNSDCVANYADASDPTGDKGKCVHCSRNSRLYFNYGLARNSKSNGVDVRRSQAQLEYADVSGAASVGIRAEYNSAVSAYGAKAANSKLFGVYSSRASTIDASFVDASGAKAYGFVVGNGGIISALGSKGNKNQECNTITAKGIIFG
jgi:hypothetical protein